MSKEKCLLCNQRKPKRFCPHFQKEICSICCALERKQISCPKNCFYFQTFKHQIQEQFGLLTIQEEFNTNLRAALLHLKNSSLRDLTDEEVLEVLKSQIEKLQLKSRGIIYEPKLLDIRKQLLQEKVNNCIEAHLTGKEGFKSYTLDALLSLLKLERRIIKEIKSKSKKENVYLDAIALLTAGEEKQRIILLE